MRILVLLTEAHGIYGGIAKFNRDLLMALCRYPKTTEVVAIPRLQHFPPTEAFPDKLTYITDGLNSKLKYIAALSKVIHRNPKFDLMMVGHLNLVPLVSITKLFVKAPTVVFLYGSDAWSPRNWLHRACLNRVDSFISISETTKNRFRKWSHIPSDRVSLMPVSVDPDAFTPGPKNAELLKKYGLDGRKVLMTMGRISVTDGGKGFDEVLEVLPDLSKQISNLFYLVVGDGTDRRRLEEKARSLGVAGRVTFTGFVPEGEKASYYRLADAYVMPSRREGFGIVFLEALACGVPIVASKIDGGREAVRDGSWGVCVSPDNLEEIKSGIVEVLNRPGGVRPAGLDYFSYHNFEQRVHDLLNRIV